MNTNPITRRGMLALGLHTSIAASLAACATPSRAAPKVVVVGGGWGGATAAKYLRLWSEGAVDVTLVEPNRRFVSCPMSNLVLGGSRSMADISFDYDGLRRWGVRVVHDRALAIDAERRQVQLVSGAPLPYDRAVVSPGIDFMFGMVRGMLAEHTEQVPHAWKAGAQTTLLRRQLESMPDGGTVLIAVPAMPYRCPPGPYERACQIAWYLKAHKPRSKVILLDANPQPVSKGPLFTRAWRDDYPGIVEHRPNAGVVEVDVVGRSFVTETGERVRGDVLNLIPPMRAADFARDAGLVTAHERWCEVDWTTLESTRLPQVHVIGDATMSAPGMPKSGHMANQHGKAAAAAIVELLRGRTPPAPAMTNTCYSYIDDQQAVHVASVHRFDAGKKTMVMAAGAGGVSSGDRSQWRLEGQYAWGWAQTVWKDMLG
jgi:sulfide dehydrogenase [flavocytochrome c] flavoprotein chain